MNRPCLLLAALLLGPLAGLQADELKITLVFRPADPAAQHARADLGLGDGWGSQCA